MKLSMDNTLGALFLGISASCILFGITLVQTHLYYHKYPKDWMLHKVAVGVLMTLATLHLIFTLHAIYYYIITNFLQPQALLSIVWSFQSQILINAVMIVCVHGLYAQRIWKLGKHFSRFWPAVVGLICMGGWALGFVVVSKAYREKSFVDMRELTPFIYASLTIVTVIDLMITSAMCYYLNKSQSSFVGTNSRVVIMLRYVLVTGSLTSACSLAVLITFATMPHNMVFIGVGFLLPYLYVNSYIGLLNARKSTNEREASSSEVSAAINIRSGLAHRMDGENIKSVDDKRGSDSLRLSSTRFNSSFSNKYDPEPDMPSKNIKILVHRAEEQQCD